MISVFLLTFTVSLSITPDSIRKSVILTLLNEQDLTSELFVSVLVITAVCICCKHKFKSRIFEWSLA